MPFLDTNSHLTTKPQNFEIKCPSNSESYDCHGFFGTKFRGVRVFFINGGSFFQRERVLWGWLFGTSHIAFHTQMFSFSLFRPFWSTYAWFYPVFLKSFLSWFVCLHFLKDFWELGRHACDFIKLFLISFTPKINYFNLFTIFLFFCVQAEFSNYNIVIRCYFLTDPV